jgi:hypothetical protein
VVPSFKHDSGEAPCPAGGSTRQALNRAMDLVAQIYFPEGCSVLLPFSGVHCSALRAELTQRRLRLPELCKDERSRRSLDQGLKSLLRLFDLPCKPCDKVASRVARSEWLAKATTPYTPRPALWSADPIGDLVRVISDMLGPDWAEGFDPGPPTLDDQNGCLERARSSGGSLSVERGVLPWGTGSAYQLRVGVAKTKGKFRTVTMQSAYVKSILRPYHERLYDFLSKRKWLVRGEFTEEHALSLGELEDGEQYISGDYSDATGNLDPRVSFAVAQELARSPSLPARVANALVESYRPENLRARFTSCPITEVYEIKRGQMMGNCFSFPILCLINRAAFTLMRRRCGLGRSPVLINGDDIAFKGGRREFLVWKDTVETFGMVVNEEKTGMSRDFVELNSKSFYVPGKCFVRKPVFSFLRPGPAPGCVLSEVLKGLKGFSSAVVLAALTMVRFEVQQRGVDPSSVPQVLHKSLVKYKWYRQALLRKVEVVETGLRRAWPVLEKDVRPPPDLEWIYERRVEEGLWFGASLFQGKELDPYKVRLKKAPVLSPGRVRLRLSRRRWVFRWPSHVWSFWEALGLPVVPLRGSWQDDHRDLASLVSVHAHAFVPPPVTLLVDAVRPDGVNWV